MLAEVLVTLGIAILGQIAAVGLAALIFKRKYPVQKWHGWLGLLLSMVVIVLSVECLQNTPYKLPFVLVGVIIAIFSFAVLRAVQRLEEERKVQGQPDRK